MKSVLIVFLILLILGLYFFTEPTKGLIKVTGKAIILLVIGIGLLVFCLAKIMMPLMLTLLFFVLLYRHSKEGNKGEKKK